MATTKSIAIREAAAVGRLVELFGDDILPSSKDADLTRAMQLEAIADKVEELATQLIEAEKPAKSTSKAKSK